MNKKEYELVLRHHEIPEQTYAIGEEINHRICFTNTDDKWQVFRKDGENKQIFKEFSKEMEACAYFFQILLIERELLRANV